MENGGKSELDPSRAREKAEAPAGEAGERLEGLKGWAEDAEGWIRSFARDRPLLAIACAVGLGFVVGRLASRK